MFFDKHGAHVATLFFSRSSRRTSWAAWTNLAPKTWRRSCRSAAICRPTGHRANQPSMAVPRLHQPPRLITEAALRRSLSPASFTALSTIESGSILSRTALIRCTESPFRSLYTHREESVSFDSLWHRNGTFALPSCHIATVLYSIHRINLLFRSARIIRLFGFF